MSKHKRNRRNHWDDGRNGRPTTGTPVEVFLDALARSIAREHQRQQCSRADRAHRKGPWQPK
jgi:hypothetical protein